MHARLTREIAGVPMQARLAGDDRPHGRATASGRLLAAPAIDHPPEAPVPGEETPAGAGLPPLLRDHSWLLLPTELYRRRNYSCNRTVTGTIRHATPPTSPGSITHAERAMMLLARTRPPHKIDELPGGRGQKADPGRDPYHGMHDDREGRANVRTRTASAQLAATTALVAAGA